MNSALSTLEEHAGGKSGGLNWTDGLSTSMSWPELQALYLAGGVIEVNPVDLVANTKAVKE
eukprot:136979-Amphidinium_carterae.1